MWDFPDPALASSDSDVVAVGADLDIPTLVQAYTMGLFPMNLDSGELAWWSPDPRGVLPLDRLRVSHSLRSSLRSYTVTFDRDFSGVIRGCADPRRESGWITEEVIAAYEALYAAGIAHSVEVWKGDELAGGLYGVEIGGLFAGESMFHRYRDASKVALVALVERMKGCPGRRLLDVQWRTEHLATLGVVEMPRQEYLVLLASVVQGKECLGSARL